MNPGIDADSPGAPMEVIDPFSNTLRFAKPPHGAAVGGPVQNRPSPPTNGRPERLPNS